MGQGAGVSPPMKPTPVTDFHLAPAERAAREKLPRAVRPKLASTVVLTIGERKSPRILMGRRSPRHDFMPSVYVFPGGRVDRADSFAAFAGDLSARTERVLEAAMSPRRARAVALAAVRETYEETGLMLGRTIDPARRRNLNHPTYDAFRAAGMRPDIAGLEVFGRAITPPHRHKRFDAWFLHKHLSDVAPPEVADSHELQDVGWFTLDEVRALELQRATVMMVDVLGRYLARDVPRAGVFFSRAVRGVFRGEEDWPG